MRSLVCVTCDADGKETRTPPRLQRMPARLSVTLYLCAVERELVSLER